MTNIRYACTNDVYSLSPIIILSPPLPSSSISPLLLCLFLLASHCWTICSCCYILFLRVGVKNSILPQFYRIKHIYHTMVSKHQTLPHFHLTLSSQVNFDHLEHLERQNEGRSNFVLCLKIKLSHLDYTVPKLGSYAWKNYIRVLKSEKFKSILFVKYANSAFSYLAYNFPRLQKWGKVISEYFITNSGHTLRHLTSYFSNWEHAKASLACSLVSAFKNVSKPASKKDFASPTVDHFRQEESELARGDHNP